MGYLFESEVYWGGGEFRWTCHRRGEPHKKGWGPLIYIAELYKNVYVEKKIKVQQNNGKSAQWGIICSGPQWEKFLLFLMRHPPPPPPPPRRHTFQGRTPVPRIFRGEGCRDPPNKLSQTSARLRFLKPCTVRPSGVNV